MQYCACIDQYTTEKKRTKHKNTILHLRDPVEKKGENMKTKEITIEQAKTQAIKMHLVGDEDLVLCGKARSYELPEIFKQSHPKGQKIPSSLTQDYNLWEKLITSIHWLNPITYHDDDWSLYTEEEWRGYMQNNKPCILAKAWTESFKEAFISCGFKDATGKSGADLRRTVSIGHRLTPINFTEAGYDMHLVPNNTMAHTNVLNCPTVFSGWDCTIDVVFLKSAFPAETVIEMVQTAGKFIGIGSRRGDGFGRYHIESVEISK